MGLFGDFFHFISSLALGQKDSSQAFLEPLTMADRYLRWGEERGDLRDYTACLTQLNQINDEDAPKADLVIRKYNLYCNATLGAVRLIMQQHKELESSARSSRNELAKEQKQLLSQLKVHQEKVDQLKADGSLISAKEEQRHVDEINTRLKAVNKSLDAEDVPSEVLESYDHMGREADRLLGNLEQALVSLETNTNLPGESVGTLRDQIVTRIESTRNEISEMAPAKGSGVDAAADSASSA